MLNNKVKTFAKTSRAFKDIEHLVLLSGFQYFSLSSQ